MFKEERKEDLFSWEMLGDISLGRPHMGDLVSVEVYRLMQYTLRDQMIKEIGVAATDRIFYQAGFRAGIEFHKNLMDKHYDFGSFIAEAQRVMKDLKIGVLRVEEADMERMNFMLTVAEDLDCSGLPVTDEEICVYDEGFIAGLLNGQTGLDFSVREIDCWCSGDRVCRFDVKLKV